jgi:hypothetical protein
MRGRIDRIDRLEQGRGYQVVDYKTGRYSDREYEGLFVHGTRLQPMVYGLAAEQLLARHGESGARVAYGAYAFPTGRGFRTVKAIALPDAGRTRGVVRLVLDVVAAGTFPGAATSGPCRRCPLGRACGEGTDERASRKLQAAPLAAFRLLREEK